jgi:hypothetical protein
VRVYASKAGFLSTVRLLSTVATAEQDAIHSAISDADGRFLVGSLSRGTYLLRAFSDTHVSGPIPNVTAPGEIDLRMFALWGIRLELDEDEALAFAYESPTGVITSGEFRHGDPGLDGQ